MKYKTGDVKKILGISVETLRYFENIGLIEPERNSINNYRYYEALDLNKIVAYKFYRAMEFSMDKSLDIINNMSNEDLIINTDNKMDTIKEKIEYYKNLYLRMEELKISFERVEHMMGVYRIEYSPEIIYYYNQINDEFETDEFQMETTKLWLDELPFVNLAVRMPVNEKPIGSKVNYGYSVKKVYESVFNRLKKSAIMTYASKKSIYTICKTINNQMLSNEHLIPVLNYINDNNVAINGDVIGWILNEEQNNKGKIRYFELWIPIQDGN
ncbi:MAG: MerR family transcriptional regulator [Eubacteriaceae bacterium]